jgi:hypothetical protein
LVILLVNNIILVGKFHDVVCEDISCSYTQKSQDIPQFFPFFPLILFLFLGKGGREEEGGVPFTAIWLPEVIVHRFPCVSIIAAVCPAVIVNPIKYFKKLACFEKIARGWKEGSRKKNEKITRSRSSGRIGAERPHSQTSCAVVPLVLNSEKKIPKIKKIS